MARSTILASMLTPLSHSCYVPNFVVCRLHNFLGPFQSARIEQRVIAYLSLWTHERTQNIKCFAQKYAIRDTCRETETQCFQRLKKTDNVLIKEKHSLCWWETAGVLPISRWIYIISEICCWRYFFFKFIYFLFFFFSIGVQKQNWLSTDRLLYPFGSNVRHFFGKGFVAIKQQQAYAERNEVT